jgi:hypothetical protein
MALVRLSMRLMFLALLLCLSTSSARPAPVADFHQPGASQSVAMHEVRLRKLHLVRPDLIPYPLDYEVVC